MTTRKLMTRVKRGEPYPWVILSQCMDAAGFPRFDAHTLAERAQTEAQALVYAERRAEQGYWVEVYREHHYYAPDGADPL